MSSGVIDRQQSYRLPDPPLYVPDPDAALEAERVNAALQRAMVFLSEWDRRNPRLNGRVDWDSLRNPLSGGCGTGKSGATTSRPPWSLVKAYVPTDEQRTSLLEELVAVATGGWKAPWLAGIALLCKADGILIQTNPRTTALFDEYRRRIPALDLQLIQDRYG